MEVLEEKKKSTGGKGNHTLAEDYVIEESLTANWDTPGHSSQASGAAKESRPYHGSTRSKRRELRQIGIIGR